MVIDKPKPPAKPGVLITYYYDTAIEQQPAQPPPAWIRIHFLKKLELTFSECDQKPVVLTLLTGRCVFTGVQY